MQASAADEPTAALGRWQLVLEARDDQGRATTMSRAFVVDDTLGFLRVPKRATLGPRTRRESRSPGSSRARARVIVTIERGTKVIRTLALGNLEAGDRAAVWDGLALGKKPAPAGAYTVRVAAIGPVGRSELARR